jgi:hypothetical protein
MDSPEEYRNFVVPDGACLLGDYHLLRGDIALLAGPPGVGKSRAAIALAVCGASRISWFGFPVHQKLRTVILQTENGKIRLHLEINEIGHEIDDCVWISEPPECGLAFHSAAFRDAVKQIIDQLKPDLVIFDPWNGIAMSEKQRDIAEAFKWIRTTIPQSLQSPAILIVAHTRKPRADERTCGRALLNNVVGSYMLVSVPRSVFVLQHASDDTNEDRIVFTCVKNNNGLLGDSSAWTRTAGGIFEPVLNFDWESFSQAKDSKIDLWRSIPEIIAELGGEMARASLVIELVNRFKVKNRCAYNWILRAAERSLIHFDKTKQVYYVNRH